MEYVGQLYGRQVHQPYLVKVYFQRLQDEHNRHDDLHYIFWWFHYLHGLEHIIYNIQYVTYYCNIADILHEIYGLRTLYSVFYYLDYIIYSRGNTSSTFDNQILIT